MTISVLLPTVITTLPLVVKLVLDLFHIDFPLFPLNPRNHFNVNISHLHLWPKRRVNEAISVLLRSLLVLLGDQ